MSVREYIGARYVPLFAEPLEWDKTRTYEPLTIVLYQGNSYTSRQYVPTNIEITDERYWAITGNYNAQIEMYRRDVAALSEDVDEFENDVRELDARIDAMDLEERVPFEMITIDSAQIGTIPFNTTTHYAQSMCLAGDYLYVFLTPISGQATYPILNKYSFNIAETATFTLESSLTITESAQIGHGNSLSFNSLYNVIVWTTSNRKSLVFYSTVSDEIVGTYSLGSTTSTEGYNNVLFSADGTRVFMSQSGGRCYYIGDIAQGICAVNSYIPFPEIGRCTLADLSFKSGYIYQAMWNTRTQNASYVMVMSFVNGYCPYIINVKNLTGETEGIEWIGNSLFICTDDGSFYRLAAIPSDSISETAGGVRIPCFNARGLERKYVNEQGKNIYFTPFIPMYDDSRKLLANYAWMCELPQGSARKMAPLNRAMSGIRDTFVDYANNELDFGTAYVNYAYRYSKIAVNTKSAEFSTSLSADDYIDALKTYFDDPGVASGTQYYNQFYACGSNLNAQEALSFIFPGYDTYGTYD